MLMFMTNRPLHLLPNTVGYISNLKGPDDPEDSVMKVLYKRQSVDQTSVYKCKNQTSKCCGICK